MTSMVEITSFILRWYLTSIKKYTEKEIEDQIGIQQQSNEYFSTLWNTFFMNNWVQEYLREARF